MVEKEQKELEKAYKRLEEQLKSRKGTAEGTITKVEVGILGDFISKDKLRNPTRANQKAIQLTIVTPDGYQIRKCMTLSVHPNSNLSRYRARYGKFPEVGGRVPLVYDSSSGFWRVSL
jgi:hypothetical protein